MRHVRRILIAVAITFAVILVSAYWTVPIALSFYAANQVPGVARIVPTDLKDHSVSQSPGMKFSYIGYEFEVPWTDLDESKTGLYPKNRPEKTRVILVFRSGLRLMMTVVRPRQYADMFATDLKVPPQKFEVVFGPGSASSDYTFERNVFDFTPDQMHHWSLSSGLHAREQMLLVVKSIMPSKVAESGIFNVQGARFRGFQQGDPQSGKDGAIVTLYDADNGLEIVFAPGNYAGLKQSEINRIIQSLRKATPTELEVPVK